MEYLLFLALLYGLPAWMIYSLTDWLIRKFSPPPPPEIASRLQSARRKIQESLEDIERHNRGEVPGYWGDSDIDRLDMALAEASEIEYQSPLRKALPPPLQAAISMCLAIGLINLAVVTYFEGNPFQRLDLDFWVEIGIPLGIAILALVFVVIEWRLSSHKNTP